MFKKRDTAHNDATESIQNENELTTALIKVCDESNHLKKKKIEDIIVRFKKQT